MWLPAEFRQFDHLIALFKTSSWFGMIVPRKSGLCVCVCVQLCVSVQRKFNKSMDPLSHWNRLSACLVSQSVSS